MCVYTVFPGNDSTKTILQLNIAMEEHVMLSSQSDQLLYLITDYTVFLVPVSCHCVVVVISKRQDTSLYVQLSKFICT